MTPRKCHNADVLHNGLREIVCFYSWDDFGICSTRRSTRVFETTHSDSIFREVMLVNSLIIWAQLELSGCFSHNEIVKLVHNYFRREVVQKQL